MVNVNSRIGKFMLTSHELRWFYPDTIPQDVVVWFQQNCLINPMEPPEKREDVYLCVPDSDYMGIKLRQGRLEIKWRQAEFGVVCFGESVEGKAEKWGKWSCSDRTGESFQVATVANHAYWVNIQKVRYLRQYQFLQNNSVKPIINDASIDNVCSVEITQLVIQNQPWWSLAFEALGTDDCLMDNLQVTADCVLSTYQGPKLIAANSYAYPHWLGYVCKIAT